MKSSLIATLVLLSSIFTPVVLTAQDFYIPPPPPDVVDTPIDGGLSLLVAAGVGYGIKKVRDSRKNEAESTN